MIDLKILIHKISVDLLKICVTKRKKGRTSDKFFPVFCEIIKRIHLLYADDEMVIAEELKKQVLDALHFGHPGSTKMLAEGNDLWWSGMRKEMENNSSTCIACMSSGKNLNCQLPSAKKINRLVLTEPGQEVKNYFSGKLHDKHINGEPYIHIGMDRYSEWPVVQVCKSTEVKKL